MNMDESVGLADHSNILRLSGDRHRKSFQLRGLGNSHGWINLRQAAANSIRMHEVSSPWNLHSHRVLLLLYHSLVVEDGSQTYRKTDTK